MSSTTSDWPMANTQHGMLVAFGEFLKQHGVMDRLMGVTIQQKTRRFAPQTKLVEFLAGIMSGLEYLQDLNEGPHPLAHLRARGQLTELRAASARVGRQALGQPCPFDQ